MAQIKTFFFDSYAFYEILAGNPKYKPYTKGIAIITTRLNLMELHYGLLANFGREVADKAYGNYVEFCIEIDDNIIKEANNLRFSLRHKKLSYIDCLGYTLAKSMSIPFLTGDLQFKDMDSVEFVR